MKRHRPWLTVIGLVVGLICTIYFVVRQREPLLRAYNGPTQVFHQSSLFSPATRAGERPIVVPVRVPTFIRADDKFVLYTTLGSKVSFAVWRGRTESLRAKMAGRKVMTRITLNGWAGGITEEKGDFISRLRPNMEVRDVVAIKQPDWFIEAKLQWPKGNSREREVVESTLASILESM